MDNNQNNNAQMNNIQTPQVNNMANNVPNQQVNNTPGNNKGNNNALIILVAILVIAVLGFGGYYVYNQIQLQKVDKELSDEAKDINQTLDKEDEETEKVTSKYTTGQKVTLVDNSTWYVMYSNDTTATLMATSNYGEITYYARQINLYEHSIPKERIDNEFLPALTKSLTDNNGNTEGLKARILDIADLRKVLNDNTTASDKLQISSDYKWLYETGSYWTMTDVENDESNVYSVYYIESWGTYATVSKDMPYNGLTTGHNYFVRPVIECSIQNIK